MNATNIFVRVLLCLFISLCISEVEYCDYSAIQTGIVKYRDRSTFSWKCNDTVIQAFHLGEEYFIESLLFPALGMTECAVVEGSLAEKILVHVSSRSFEALSAQFFKQHVLSIIKEVAEDVPIVREILDAFDRFNAEIGNSVCRVSGFIIDKIGDRSDFQSLYFKNYFNRLSFFEKTWYWIKYFYMSVVEDWESFYNGVKVHIDEFVRDVL